MASSTWFQTNPAPGRAGNSAPPAPVEGQPSAPAGHEAPPAAFGGGYQLLILALPLVVLFLMTRSQSKKQQQLESSLKVGDRVVTQSGLLGKIIEISAGGGRAKLEIAPGVNVQVLKSSIQGLDGGETPAADAKAAADKKDVAKEKPQEKRT